ncbi:MAG: hypothetical protein JWN44_1217 [Myxococcales bacterium]|nr:hypothetical protein [Myxococcales bacterium]
MYMVARSDSTNLDELLLDTAWVRRVAVALVAESADADDVAQLTVVAAIERPPADPSEPRRWLLTVARNIARMMGRTTARRARREALVEHEPVPTPEALVGRAELQSQLARLLTELDEPYRTTVLLRYFEDLAPSDIAERLGIPAGTVRWRLKRGLDQLRSQLDGTHANRRSSWILTMTALERSGKPQFVPLAVKGTLIMTKKLLIAAAALLLLLLLLNVEWHRVSPPIAAKPASAEASGPMRPRSSLRRAPPFRLPTATKIDAPSLNAGELGGRVLSAADGKPIARATLTFLHRGLADSSESDDSGHFRLRPDSPGAYELTSAVASGFAPFEPALGHSPLTLWARAGVRLDDITIYLTPAIALTVVVKDNSGKPISSAEVRVFDQPQGFADGKPTLTDDTGQAHVSARPFVIIEVRRSGYVGARASVGAAVEADRRLELRLIAGSERPRLEIQGRVVDARGQGVDGALVEAEVQSAVGDRFATNGQTLSSADGTFVVSALDDYDYTMRASARGFAGTVKRDVHAGSRDVALALGAATAILRGTVRDGAAKPVVAFTLVARSKEGVIGRGPEEFATVVDGDGHYELALAPGTYQVAAAARGLARSPWQMVTLSDAATLNFTLRAGSRLFGHVIDRGSGQSIAGARVMLESDTLTDGVTTLSDATTDADGHFSLDGLMPGRQALTISAVAHDGRCIGSLEVPADGALGPVTIDLAPAKPGEETTEFFGIGAQLGADPVGIVVKRVNPGGGAADAGLLAGDVILTVDGEDVGAVAFIDAIQLIRGPENSVVSLRVRRRDAATEVIQVTRKRVTY